MTSKFIPAGALRPGQEFVYYGNEYRRATAEEERRHPCRQVDWSDPVIYVYQGTMPATVLANVRVNAREV